MFKKVYVLLALALAVAVQGFVPTQSLTSRNFQVYAVDESASTDPNDIVARRIIVKGDVQGGYYRSCVLNEVCWNMLGR